MGALEEQSGGGPNDVLRLIAKLQQERDGERHERIKAEARLGVQLAAYEVLVAGAFRLAPWIPDPEE
jgi:hypothetical protein